MLINAKGLFALIFLQKTLKFNAELACLLTTRKANSYKEVAVGEGEERGRRGWRGKSLIFFLENNTVIEKSGNAYRCV